MTAQPDTHINPRIDPSWRDALAAEWQEPYMVSLSKFIHERYASGADIYPPARRIFAAMDACPLDGVKVVIIGQDPYHGPGQADGICFSVGEGIAMPPSLINILREVSRDTGVEMPQSGSLERWARQGVLMLNTLLTVERGRPGSHAGRGWERFTDAIVSAVNKRPGHGVVFMLWGSHAQAKCAGIDRARHLVLTTSHPSPLSAYRGFNGCSHFSTANRWLAQHGLEPIKW